MFRVNRFLFSLALVSLMFSGMGSSLSAVDTGKSSQSAPILNDYEVQKLKIGGDFTLTNQDGKLTNLKEYRTKVVVLFFGYTYCPDVCPITMTKIGRLRKLLGKQATRFQPVFISIDPERDTPARLKAYLANFENGAIGLTGTKDEVDKAAGLYRARFEKEDVKSATQYLMAHTAYVYMLDGHGKLRYVFPPDVEESLLVDGARRLAQEP
jgi:protein SCO1/2